MRYYKSIIGNLLVFLFFAFFPLSTQAQNGHIVVGDMVKIYAPSFDSGRIVGWVEEVASIGILVSSGNKRMNIPYNTIQSLKVKRGKQSRRSLGIVLGMIPGAIGGALTMKNRCNSEEQVCFMDFTDLENALRVMTGMAIGMTVGSLIGASFEKDRWQRVSVGVAFNQPKMHSESYTLSPSISFRIPLNRRR
ncbi:MAG TPA: hypothetical protein VJ905_13815 [Halalkalibaculum sp.]|nr:hypothetical protein [Halalkalibaculum sp.]